MRLVGEVLQTERIHRALQAHVKVAHFTFRQRDDAYADKGQALEQAGGVFLIAAEAVQRFGEHIDAEPRVERGAALSAAWWNRAAQESCDYWSAPD